MVDPEPLDDYPDGPPATGLLSHLMTIPVAHTPLACCGGIMCMSPGRQLMSMYLLMLICVKMTLMFVKLPVYVRRVPEVAEVVAGAVVRV